MLEGGIAIHEAEEEAVVTRDRSSKESIFPCSGFVHVSLIVSKQRPMTCAIGGLRAL